MLRNRCDCTKPCHCITRNNNISKNAQHPDKESNLKRILNSRSTSSSSTSISEDAYTEWRQLYERSSSQLSNYYTKVEDLQFADLPVKFLSMKDQELIALREFRLQNSNECFSEDSILPLIQRIERQNHTCEYNFKINKRGLLESKLQTADGKDVCTICKKPSDTPTTFKVGIGKTTTPIIPSLRTANGKVVIDDERAKDLGKINFKPRSNLALSHKRRKQ